MTRASTDFDPYRKWLGIPKERQSPNFYELLAITLDEDDPDVIGAAVEQRRRFIESKRGEGREAAVAEILYQIGEAEVTLLDPAMRRDYDRRVGLFEKRKRARRIDPNAPRTRFESRPGRTVGEDSGTVRLFAGIMAVLVVGCGLVTLMSGLLPWGKPAEKVNAATKPAAAKADEEPVSDVPTDDPAPEPAAPSAAAAVTATPQLVEPAWISLLGGGSPEGWRPADFPGAGSVRLEDGAWLLGRGENLTGVTWREETPRGDYELRLEARRVEGGDFFCGLTFPVADEHCSLVVGGWGGEVVGLSNVDGKDASRNETTRRRSFEAGRWYKIRLSVADRRIKAWIDDEPVVDLDATGKTLSVRREAEPSKPLGVTAWRTAAAVRNIEHRPLTNSPVDPPASKPEPVAETPGPTPAERFEEADVVEPAAESLFNGTDLTGWRFVVPPTIQNKSDVSACWTVDAERKVLVARANLTHWLETEERFGDFVLSLEWRFPPTGTIDSNGSGIVVRSSGLDGNSRNPRGIEIDFRPAHGEQGRMATGSLIAYDVPASNHAGAATPEVRGLVREKPPGPTPADGWNTCEITCRGDRLTVVMNGERVNEGWGLERSPGAICLRSQESVVEFRNLRVRRLDGAGPTETPPASAAPAAPPRRDRAVRPASTSALGRGDFVFGVNLPWFDGAYGHDLGPEPQHPDYRVWYKGPAVTGYFRDIRDIGFRVVRVWLMERAEGWKVDRDGIVTGLDETFLRNLDDLVRRAEAENLKLYLCLTTGFGGLKYPGPINDARQQRAYIENAVKPLARRLKGSGAVFAFDIINEIESDLRDAVGPDKKVTIRQAREFIRANVRAIKAEDSDRLVSAGSGYHGWDAVQQGHYSGLGLDFYDIHVYSDTGHLPHVRELNVDRPVVIGEFGQATRRDDDALQRKVVSAFIRNAAEMGYAGCLVWAYGPKEKTFHLVRSDGSHRPVVAEIKDLIRSRR